jgi:hypothetical protein
MTVFESIKSKNIDEIVDWLDEYGDFDGSPWMKYFNENYCGKCETIMCHYENSDKEFPCSWCELFKKCKFFRQMDDIPDNKDIIKMWLESSID